MLYESGPVSVSEFLSNVPEKIHQELYRDAMSGFLATYAGISTSTYKIIEKREKEYWMPSYINVISLNSIPRTRKLYWLGPWWNKSRYTDKSINRVSEIQNNIKDTSEIDYIDYTSGNVTMKDRLTSEEFKTDFKKLSKNIPVSDGYDVHDTTFGYLGHVY